MLYTLELLEDFCLVDRAQEVTKKDSPDGWNVQRGKVLEVTQGSLSTLSAGSCTDANITWRRNEGNAKLFLKTGIGKARGCRNSTDDTRQNTRRHYLDILTAVQEAQQPKTVI